MSLQVQQIPFIEEASPNSFLRKEKGYDINLIGTCYFVLVTNSKGTGALDQAQKWKKLIQQKN